MHKGSSFDGVRYLDFPKVCDPRGNLSFIEGGCHVPFAIKRVFYIYDVPGGATRGAHAHKTCTEILIPIAGSFDVHLSDGREERIYHLSRSNRGIVIPPGYWLSTHDYTTGTVCLVLCSDYYEESDYIRDFEEFCEWKQNDTVSGSQCD